MGVSTGAAVIFGATGGVMEAALRTAYELYTGKIINGKQEITDFLTGTRADKDESEWMVTDRPDLRIIEPEQFEKAQQILHGRNQAFHLKKERQSNKYLFSTLIKCKECGWSFRRIGFVPIKIPISGGFVPVIMEKALTVVQMLSPSTKRT